MNNSKVTILMFVVPVNHSFTMYILNTNIYCTDMNLPSPKSEVLVLVRPVPMKSVKIKKESTIFVAENLHISSCIVLVPHKILTLTRMPTIPCR